MNFRKRLYPWAGSIPGDLAVKIATLGLTGKMKAPGTWGSAAGILLYLLFFQFLSAPLYIIFALLLAYAAMAVCDRAEERLGSKDPGMIVLDEFAAIPLCFLPFAPLANCMGFWTLLAGFAVFRFFDIAKPFGIKGLQRHGGGFACVIDDLAAALCTFAVLQLLSVFHVIAQLSEK